MRGIRESDQLRGAGRHFVLALGNGLMETTTYTQQLQLQPIQAGRLLTLGYTYGTAAAKNNGNVATQTITRGAQSWSHTYQYLDGKNRLTNASETGVWSQQYIYDDVGNRALLVTPNDPGLGLANVLAIRTPGTDLAQLPLDTSNHWTGVTYDAVGNLVHVPLSPDSFDAVYDTKNHQTSTTAVIGGTTTAVTYSYNGDGPRVQKAVSRGSTVTYVYGGQGIDFIRLMFQIYQNQWNQHQQHQKPPKACVSASDDQGNSTGKVCEPCWNPQCRRIE